MVVFEKCDITKRPEGAKCKTEEEIEAWMAFKYILLCNNDARFIQHKFGENRVEKKSQLAWYALNYNTRVDVPKIVTRSDVQLGDNIYNIAGLFDER